MRLKVRDVLRATGGFGLLVAVSIGWAQESETRDETTPAPPGKLKVADAPSLSPKDAQITFKLPPGFEIQLVASEPDIQKPMQLAFDEKGALLVSTSTGYPLGAGEGEIPNDRVMRIEIDGLTGRATKVVTFASGFDICSGIEALPGGRVILANAPDILLLTDSDGDGAADEREVLYTGFTRDDTHELPNSFTWGIDGWIYALQGHINVSDVTDRLGRTTAIHHANVFRFRPDGTAIEMWAPGMSNPWGLAFDENNNLFATDCQTRPLWQIVRGFAYPGYLQPDEPLGYAPPIVDDPHDASGFAGLVHYALGNFPEPYSNSLYLGNPITNVIHRDRLEAQGSTVRAVREHDFLVSSDPWFRPVDIEIGPDGALYIADWYNRIISHVEVPLDHPERDKTRGRIWRVVYWGDDARSISQARQYDGPGARDWSQASELDLLEGLKDENAWNRRMASNQLLDRGFPEAYDRLQLIARDETAESMQRSESLWLLARAKGISVGDLEQFAGDSDDRFRMHAVRLIGELRFGRSKRETVERLLMNALCDPWPLATREGAVALGVEPGPASWEALLVSERDYGADTMLDYAMLRSMRAHLMEPPIIAAYAEWSAAIRNEHKFVDALAGTPTEEGAELLSRLIAEGQIPESLLDRALKIVLLHGTGDVVERTFARRGSYIMDAEEPEQRTYATAILRHGQRTWRNTKVNLDPLLEALARRLGESRELESKSIALQAGAHRKFFSLTTLADEIFFDQSLPVNLRREAVHLMIAVVPNAAARVLTARLKDASETQSAKWMMTVYLASMVDTPEEFDDLLATIDKQPSSVYRAAVEGLLARCESIELLLAAVEAGDINPAYINDAYTKLRIRTQFKDDPAIDEWLDRLTENAPDTAFEDEAIVANHLAGYLARKRADLHNGQAMFENNCGVCHSVGSVGGSRAPNLDGAGERGLERLLQDIIMPSKDIDPSFRTMIVTRKDGEYERGLIVEQGAGELRLMDEEGREIAVPREEIAFMEPVWVSPMPSGFGSAFADEDFYDLIAFLLAPPENIKPIVLTGE